VSSTRWKKSIIIEQHFRRIFFLCQRYSNGCRVSSGEPAKAPVPAQTGTVNLCPARHYDTTAVPKLTKMHHNSLKRGGRPTNWTIKKWSSPADVHLHRWWWAFVAGETSRYLQPVSSSPDIGNSSKLRDPRSLVFHHAARVIVYNSASVNSCPPVNLLADEPRWKRAKILVRRPPISIISLCWGFSVSGVQVDLKTEALARGFRWLILHVLPEEMIRRKSRLLMG